MCITIYSSFIFKTKTGGGGVGCTAKWGSALNNQFRASQHGACRKRACDPLTWYLTQFSAIIAGRGNCIEPLHIIRHLFLEPQPGDTVTLEIQLGGMLLNFWRGWRAAWKRYCSRVFHRRSDQYHQILNMGRNHSLWRMVGGKLNKGWKTRDLLPWMLTKKPELYIYIKQLEAGAETGDCIYVQAPAPHKENVRK